MVVEFILTRKAALATTNYYFEKLNGKGYTERRQKILRPLSNDADIRENMINLTDLHLRHRQAIELTLKAAGGAIITDAYSIKYSFTLTTPL